MKPLYREIASLVRARANCLETSNTEWKVKHEARLRGLVREHMPSGAGIDSGTEIDLDASTPDKLVFTFGFHHMDEHGFYDGWTFHKALVLGSLENGIHLRITGPNRNEVKDYLHDLFHECLTREVSP